ncbi:MAG: alpha/beta hydrolase [Proteobacteria bacterium]|nr:alpha/beta hydrolase [Pseudomonadota bacterium]
MSMNPAFPEPTLVDAGDVNLAVHQMGAGRPIILVHGFPELAFSWRHQIPILAAAGYHVIAPDMRGYGGSDKPADVADYTIQKLTGDLTGLMDALGLDEALVVGHDWGALVTWQMALLNPERMSGLVALNIPFFKRPPINPITFMRFKIGKDFYIVNFQKSDEADRRFAEDPARFIDVMMRRRRVNRTRPQGKRVKRRPLSLLEMLDREDPGGEVLLTPDELRIYANAFESGGFTGPINWYRNFSQNWRSTKYVDQVVRPPALFIGASDDAIVSERQIEAMKTNVVDLEIRMIEDCGHWMQQEKPAELNEILLDWLLRRYPA